jgi:hypothetical protein
MSAALVVVVALALAPGSQGANELIARLGAPRFADREAAASALEALGRAALPSLQAARQHPDLEIRSRVNGLVVKIEGALLLEPTPVRLDFQDRPVEEVIPEIARRAGIPLVYNVRGPSRMITLVSERPVPFWEALDRLCEAGGLGYAFNAPNGSNLNNRSLLLAPGFDGLGGRRSDHGPFRVNLIGLHYEGLDTCLRVHATARSPGRPARRGLGQDLSQSGRDDRCPRCQGRYQCQSALDRADRHA